MSRRTSTLLGLATLAVLALAGCQHTCNKPAAVPVVAQACPCSPCAPSPGARLYLPPTAQPLPPGPVPVPPSLPETREYGPPVKQPEPVWRPRADESEPGSGAPPKNGVRLQTPEPPAPMAKTHEEPPSSPALPAIAQFETAKEQITSGLRPGLDGVKWLKDNGYKSVLHLRQPGEDDAADRNLFEVKGIKYFSLEVSPAALSQKLVDNFNRIVADNANLPLFVYSKDGAPAGALWYLHFRSVDKLSDEAARTKAAQLGLKADQNSELWLAIQKYLSEQGR